MWTSVELYLGYLMYMDVCRSKCNVIFQHDSCTDNLFSVTQSTRYCTKHFQ